MSIPFQHDPARAFATLIACLVLMVAPGVDAQALALFDVAFEVSPAVAAPGVTRQVTMRFVAGCNHGAKVVGTDARRRTVTVLLDVGDWRCDMFFPNVVTIPITPDSEGDLRLVVINTNGSYSGETMIRARAAVSNRSTVDLTGMWYDPSTRGSGVTFVHGATGSDQVFGTWYVYDAAGNPRWYSIQGVQWQGGTRATGTLYLTSANSISCLPPLVGCPVAIAAVAPLGTVNIELITPDSALITATATAGGASFSSLLLRSVF